MDCVCHHTLRSHTYSSEDWNLYIPTLAPGGTIFLLGVSSGNITLPYDPLIDQGLRIQGSLVASRHRLTQMLDFAARHMIKPIVMQFPLSVDGIEEAFGKLKDGSMRYRGVLVPVV
jgi:D-arabinose 1-dehydrogenase-like Zn-dependent alcohol dehydrogenase